MFVLSLLPVCPFHSLLHAIRLNSPPPLHLSPFLTQLPEVQYPGDKHQGHEHGGVQQWQSFRRVQALGGYQWLLVWPGIGLIGVCALPSPFFLQTLREQRCGNGGRANCDVSA